jgi:hypothetical protein
VLILAVTGCVRLVWTKRGVTEQEWRADSYACERDMRQSGYYGTGLAGALNAQDFYGRCLQSKGYYKVPADQVQQVHR